MEFMDGMMAQQAVDRGRRLRLMLTPVRDCWVLLPPQLANHLYALQAPMPVVLRLVAAEPMPGKPPLPPRLVAWAGGVSPGGNGTLGMPAALASCLGFQQGMMLLVDALPPGAVVAAEHASVEPATGSDWEVLELNAGHLEDQLLAQVGVVAAGQEFPVWVRRQALVRLRCTSTAPAGAACVRLLPGTELYVAPRPRLTGTAGNTGNSGNGSIEHLGEGQHGEAGGSQDVAEKQQQQPPPVWLRVQDAGQQQLLSLGAATGDAGAASTCAHATAETGAAITSWLTTAALVSPATLSDLGLQPGSLAQLSTRAGVGAVARLCVVVLPGAAVARGHVALPPPLQGALGAPVHSYVRLQQLPPPQGPPVSRVPDLALHPVIRQGAGAAADATAVPSADTAAAVRSSANGARRPASASNGAALQKLEGTSNGSSSPESGAAGLLTRLAQSLSSTTGVTGGKAAPPGPQQQWQQQQQWQGSADTSNALAELKQHPEAATQAVMAWMRCQAAAITAIAASAGCPALGLPMAVPLLMHVAVPAPSSHQQQHSVTANGNVKSNNSCAESAAHGSGTSHGRRVAAASDDHIMLLLPEQLQPRAQPTATDAGNKRSLLQPQVLLPSALLPPPSPATNTHTPHPHPTLPPPVQQPAFKVDLAGPVRASLARLPADAIRSKGLLLPAPAPGALLPSDLDWLQQQLEACLKRVAPRLEVAAWGAVRRAGLPLPGGLLVTGASGSGKTALMQVLSACMSNHPRHLAHTLHLDCKALAGSPYGTAAAAISAVVREGLECCPCLVVLEDLDLLCPAGGEGPEQAMQDQDTATRLSEWLADVMAYVRSQERPLVFAASAAAAAGLAPVLRQAGCLDCEVRLPAPGAKGRATMLVAQLRQRGVAFPRAQLQALAAKAEGYDARDLAVLLDRALHAALARRVSSTATIHPSISNSSAANGNIEKLSAGNADNGAGDGEGLLANGDSTGRAQQRQRQQQQQQQIEITEEDLQAAFTGFVPAAFWNVASSASKASTAGQLEGWQDVGGLQEAVAALQEALVLPSKYAALVARAPLRLRTGLLLYGPPGCGKTHVVAAAAAATRLRFISVKGPELLNKYIGQSEAAVRELFGRAAAAAPCILFFDEFDAIAPPRGHDSTGVTDRVVNQLLTELDGVEGLKGVAVVGATSRPDLIDAALLRPGRLDRLVYCGFPDSTQRLQILRAAARKLPLSHDVDLAWLAARCDGFTGADLGAVLSEAQLLAVHDELDRREQLEARHQAAVPAGVAAGAAEAADAGAPDTAGAASPSALCAIAGGDGASTLQQSKEAEPGTGDAHNTSSPSAAADVAGIGPGDPGSSSAAGSSSQAREGDGTSPVAPLISMAHVKRALQAARPSLPMAEQQRLAAVYARFMQSRDPGIANREGPTVEDKGKRATLA